VVSTTPAYPKTLATVLVAALGTLVLSVGWIVTSELLGAASGVPAPVPVRRGPISAAAESPATETGPANAEAAVEAVAPGVAPPLAATQPEPMSNPSVGGGIPYDAIASLARDLQASGRQGSRIVILGAQRQMPVARVAIALARTLAEKARVVVVDLMFEPPGLSAIAVDRDAPGIGDLVAGSASFGQIITRDRYSAAHLVMAGAATRPAHAILNSRQFSLAIEALAHSYNHVVINAGGLGDLPMEHLAPLAPRAALVADESGNVVTVSAQEQLHDAGFRNVTVLPGAPAGSDAPLTGSLAAA
jgi:Mrp family chromosome partitioning ATPase